MNYLEKSHSEKCIVLHIYLYYASITIFDVKERNFKLFHFHPILMQFFAKISSLKRRGHKFRNFTYLEIYRRRRQISSDENTSQYPLGHVS